MSQNLASPLAFIAEIYEIFGLNPNECYHRNDESLPALTIEAGNYGPVKVTLNYMTLEGSKTEPQKHEAVVNEDQAQKLTMLIRQMIFVSDTDEPLIKIDHSKESLERVESLCDGEIEVLRKREKGKPRA
jgi:hypothetical protein